MCVQKQMDSNQIEFNRVENNLNQRAKKLSDHSLVQCSNAIETASRARRSGLVDVLKPNDCEVVLASSDGHRPNIPPDLTEQAMERQRSGHTIFWQMAKLNPRAVVMRIRNCFKSKSFVHTK